MEVMRRILTELLVFFLFILSAQIASALKVGGLKNPHNIIIDPATRNYYVSGHSKSTGYIWKINSTGKRRVFIEGGKNGITLTTPRGLAIYGTELYVLDGKTIRRFDKTTGASTGIIELLGIGGNTLNGLVFGDEGQLFITDGPRNSIYKIDTQNKHNVSVLVKHNDLAFPQGIAFDIPRERLIVLSRKRILSVDLEGKIVPLLNRTFQGLAGVCWDRNGNLLVSDRAAGKVYLIRNFSIVETVQENIFDPAGISFDYSRNQILVPSAKGKLVFSLPLK